MRRRNRKRIGTVERKPLPKPLMANQSWSMDFVSDGLADGRRFRCLNIVDDCTRECLATEVDTSLTGSRVKAVMRRLAATRGLPRSITVDHGPEFEGQVLDSWAYEAGVQLSFIRPGKPNENAYIESFNGKFRDECLNEHWFVTMAQARRTSPMTAHRKRIDRAMMRASMVLAPPSDHGSRRTFRCPRE